MQLLVLCFLACVAMISAFAPLTSRIAPKTSTKNLQMASQYWEGDYPPSSVLGLGAKIPSAIYGPFSLVAFAVGTYCIHESNILNQITPETIYAPYIAGSALVPISWGMHVAAWIQKKNGK